MTTPKKVEKRKIHFANSNGLHLCNARRSFIDELLMSEDFSVVTCQKCLKGKRSRAWREYLGLDKVTITCSSCGLEKEISADKFRDRMRQAKTKKLYCSLKCQARKTPKKISLVLEEF